MGSLCISTVGIFYPHFQEKTLYSDNKMVENIYSQLFIIMLFEISYQGNPFYSIVFFTDKVVLN